MKKSVFFHVFLFSSILLLVGERHVQAAVTATQTNSVMNSFRKTPGETSDPVTQFVKQSNLNQTVLDRNTRYYKKCTQILNKDIAGWNDIVLWGVITGY